MSAASKSAARKSRASTGKRTAQPQTPKSNGAETMTSAQRRSAAAKRAAAASVKPRSSRTAAKSAARKSTPKSAPKSTRTESKSPTRAAAAKSTPKSTETTPRVGAVADAAYKRAADHATAIMRAIAAQRSSASGEYKRAGVSTPAAAFVHGVVKSRGGSVSAAIGVKLPTLAAYAAGMSDDARSDVRDFAVDMVGIKRDSDGKPSTSRDAHGATPRGVSKLGGRKLAGLLVALAVDSDGWKPTGPAARLIRETRPSK